MTRYVTLAGDTYFSTPNTGLPSLSITGDLDMEADMSLDNWASVPNTQAPVGYQETVADRRYNMVVTSTGMFHFWYDTGDVQRNAGITHDLTGAARHTLRMTQEHVAGTTTVKGYIDGVLKDTAGRTSGPLRAAPGDLDVGRNAGTQYFVGNIYSVQVLDGIGGPPVAVFDPDDIYEVL